MERQWCASASVSTLPQRLSVGRGTATTARSATAESARAVEPHLCAHLAAMAPAWTCSFVAPGLGRADSMCTCGKCMKSMCKKSLSWLLYLLSCLLFFISGINSFLEVDLSTLKPRLVLSV